MPQFVTPAIGKVHRDYIGQHQNNPVNIELCTEIISRDDANGYGKNYPVIEFKGCGVIWYYGEKGHKARDEQYQNILSTFSPIEQLTDRLAEYENFVEKNEISNK